MGSLDPRYAFADNLERVSDIRSAPLRSAKSSERSEGISILILNKDKPKFIIPLTQQILKAAEDLASASPKIEIECLIGDTGSTDASVIDHYKSLPNEIFQIVGKLEYHFSSNNNKLAELSRFRTLCFCNNDIIFQNSTEFFRDSLQSCLELPRGSIVGQQLLFPDQSIQHAGVFFSPHQSSWALPYHPGAKEKAAFNSEIQEVPAITGALFFIDASTFAELGQFDEGYEAECQDADLCLKAARMGSQSFLMRKHKVTHFENGTRRIGEVNNKDRSKFLRLWQNFLEQEQL